jgi:hypothetical protein
MRCDVKSKQRGSEQRKGERAQDSEMRKELESGKGQVKAVW